MRRRFFFAKVLQKIKSATLEELLEVDGMNKTAAENIRKFFGE